MLEVADVANLSGNKILQISHPFAELIELTCLSEYLPMLTRPSAADICIDQWGSTLLPVPTSSFPYMDWATVSHSLCLFTLLFPLVWTLCSSTYAYISLHLVHNWKSNLSPSVNPDAPMTTTSPLYNHLHQRL